MRITSVALPLNSPATKEYRHDCLPFDEDRIVSFSHNYGPEYTAATLAWLESHGRRIVDNGRALQLEPSKIAQ